MNKNGSAPSYSRGLFEYFLVANPDDVVCNRVMKEKQAFYGRYKQAAVINMKPHITVASFFAPEAMEDTCIKWIQRVCSQQHSFPVVLNNFSGFPAHTIYLRVQNPQTFRLIAKQLKVIDNYVQSNNCPPATLVDKPHLTIADKLPEDVYEKAMMEYSPRDFHCGFMVQEFMLLKRKNQFDECEKVMVFRFLPELVDLFQAKQEQYAVL